MKKSKTSQTVFLPIKPKYAFSILEGKKKVEFRKVKFNKDVKYVIIYASSPYKKVIGYFKLKKIVSGNPRMIWEKYKDVGCIEKLDFFEYYKDQKIAYAIEINKVKKLKSHIEPSKAVKNFKIPQSFSYLDELTSRGMLEPAFC